MTLASRQAAEVALIPMTADEAKSAVDRIKSHMNEARRLIYDLYQRQGWQALGYGSWRECVTAEFDQAQSQLYRQLDAAIVERAISPMGEIGESPERRLRPLAPIKDRPELVREAWSYANEISDGQPTHRDVATAVDQVMAEEEAARPFLFAASDDTPEGFTKVEVLIPEKPSRAWTASEEERRGLAERGFAVLANQRCDHSLIEWAKETGRWHPIDRTSYPLGNPFRINEEIGHDRAEVIRLYREHWLPLFHDAIDWPAIEGKVLGCWCHPLPCHGDCIIENLPNEGGGDAD
jgi:hypothetical protein